MQSKNQEKNDAGDSSGRNDELGWGALEWLVDGAVTPGAEQTLGVVDIWPGQQNPMHIHPNCDEVLYVMSGACEHILGDEVVRLSAGDFVHIPRGVKHQAKCIGAEPMRAIISFSSPHRETQNLDGQGEA